MNVMWKFVGMLCVIGLMVGLARSVVIRSGEYMWITIGEAVGIERTDTGQYVLMPVAIRGVINGQNIIDTDVNASGLSVEFFDQTVRPGRVTLSGDGVRIDVLEAGVTFNELSIQWEGERGKSNQSIQGPP